MFEQWQGFNAGKWRNKIDVRSFIQTNYTPYEGNEVFLVGTTTRTQTLNFN